MNLAEFLQSIQGAPRPKLEAILFESEDYLAALKNDEAIIVRSAPHKYQLKNLLTHKSF